ncbi:MAG: dehydrogenase [Deltaproteobacteria bacterium]|nr:dehydrogenase [Deltaproteobacteria bacterium]
MSSPEMIEHILKSGLAGRGGGAFLTGAKWKAVADRKAPVRYVICNGAEGEPGSFKDRAILSAYSQLVFEGMTIAAIAAGAREGILFLRAEYAYMRPHLESVLNARKENGQLGKNINGVKGADFEITIREGDGAYICGQETALIEFLEGFRGEPRNRPPYPAENGYYGCPTLVHNVETLGWVTSIFEKGVKWFRSLGSKRSPGLKLFSVSGDCASPGVYEFPLGLSVNEILEVVGAGDVKGVQIGGASGKIINPLQFERKIDAVDLPYGGAIIIFGKNRDMLEVAHSYLEFFSKESCGQCTPCRAGIVKILNGVKALRDGSCTMSYLNRLVELGETIELSSKCGLGQSAPAAFLSIVKHYPDELTGKRGDNRGYNRGEINEA